MVKNIGVMGAGQMGSGIAQVAALSGFSVLLQDISKESLDKALKRIDQSLEKLVEKKIAADADAKAARERIKTTTAIEDFAGVELAIEAVTENPTLKFELFKEARSNSWSARSIGYQYFFNFYHNHSRAD